MVGNGNGKEAEAAPGVQGEKGGKKKVLKAPKVSANQVVNNVLSGIRTKTDLRRCGCDVCLEALKRLGDIERGR
jgi:hypothetical protein